MNMGEKTRFGIHFPCHPRTNLPGGHLFQIKEDALWKGEELKKYGSLQLMGCNTMVPIRLSKVRNTSIVDFMNDTCQI